MKELRVLKGIIRTVPQWYLGTRGPCVHEIAVGEVSISFCSHQPLTAKAHALLEFARGKIDQWVEQLPALVTPAALAKISEEMVITWLGLTDASVSWCKWIAYAEELRLRTHENRRVSMNLIISSGAREVGSTDLTNEELQKIIATLAVDPQVYFKVDRALRFLDYDEVRWEQVTDSTEYKYSPEFLRPVLSVMGPGDYCGHLTPEGELIVLDESGMLASCRKGQWHIYEADALRDAIVAIIGHQVVGSNLFEILFDLSYRRRGALLIFDPDHRVVRHIVNRASLLTGDQATADLPRRLLRPRISSIHMADKLHKSRKKRLFLAVAELDGAVVFDTDQVLAFGAMIEPHPDVGSHFGARMTAAESAQRWGGYSFHISADGDLSVLHSGGQDGARRSLQFM